MQYLPNILSIFRLIAAPFLLLLAFLGYKVLFLIILALSLLSDAVDGFIARKLNVSSDIGTKLDSWGDFATYVTVPLCAWWLWPDILRREAFFVILVICAYIIPITIGFFKFKKLTSYHTWMAKLSTVIIGPAVFMMFIFDLSLPFRVAAVIQTLSAIEEVFITLSLNDLQNNVQTLWHIKRLNRSKPNPTIKRPTPRR
jgi:CDP-diacylglycerol--glycerol-3-phosphate 3-phosphatidyltransferase